MEFFYLYLTIVIVAIILFNVLLKPKFECPECKTVHTKGDAKSQKATDIRYSHTRKDGERDKRFNQSGTQHYDLTFDCKSCGKEFVEDYSGIIDNYLARRRNTVADKIIEDNPKFVESLKEIDEMHGKAIEELKKQPKRTFDD